MGALAFFLQWALGAWLFLIGALLIFRILSGGILLTGLLSLEARAPFGLDRLQLVAVTVFFAGGYVVASLYRGPGDKLPDIPTPLLFILIGSHGTYLTAKFAALRRGMGRGT